MIFNSGALPLNKNIFPPFLYHLPRLLSEGRSHLKLLSLVILDSRGANESFKTKFSLAKKYITIMLISRWRSYMKPGSNPYYGCCVFLYQLIDSSTLDLFPWIKLLGSRFKYSVRVSSSICLIFMRAVTAVCFTVHCCCSAKPKGSICLLVK